MSRAPSLVVPLVAALIVAACGGSEPEPAASESGDTTTDTDVATAGDDGAAGATDSTAASDPVHDGRVRTSVEAALDLTATDATDPCDDPTLDAVLAAAIEGLEERMDDPVTFGGEFRMETERETAVSCYFGRVETVHDESTTTTDAVVEVRWSQDSPIASMALGAGDAVTTAGGAPAAITDRHGDDDGSHQQTAITTVGGSDAIIVNSPFEWVDEEQLLDVLDAVLALGD